MQTGAIRSTRRDADATDSRIASALGLFDALADAVIVCGRDQAIIDLNPAAERFIGYTLDQIGGAPLAALAGPSQRRLIDSIGPALERDGRWQGEIAVQTGSGSWRVLDALVLRVAPAVDGRRGACVQAGASILVGRDITAQAERSPGARSLPELRLRRLADAPQVLIWHSGTDALHDYFNQPWLDFTGRSLEQELGRGWLEGLHPQDAQRCRAAYRRAFDAREPFQIDYRLRRRDGEYRWMLDSGAPRYAAGSFEGYVGSCIDISDHVARGKTPRIRTDEPMRANRDKNELPTIMPGPRNPAGWHGAPAAKRGFRILLIDDSRDATEPMGSLLALLHYDVRTAINAGAGLALARSFEPHLVLSDIGLPDMDGYRLAPALRQAAGNRKMILAAASGYGMAGDRMRSLAAGFDYHLVKPIDADALLKFVARQAASY